MMIQKNCKKTTVRIEIMTDQGDIEKSRSVKAVVEILTLMLVSLLDTNKKTRPLLFRKLYTLIGGFLDSLVKFKKVSHAMKGECDCNGCG